jgi:hypothetical protein
LSTSQIAPAAAVKANVSTAGFWTFRATSIVSIAGRSAAA